MKKLKYIIVFMVAVMAIGRLEAQEYKVAIENSKDAELKLEDFIGDLPIEGYSGNEIIITASSGDFQPPEKAKGLKPIYGGGTDNTGIGLEMVKEGNKIQLHCLLPGHKDGGYRIKVPDAIMLRIKSGPLSHGETTISNFKGEIEYNGYDHINLKNVTGPVVVSTINGGINVTFSEINKDKPVSLVSVNGEIDVTLPAKAAVELQMSTVNGSMYSDFDLSAASKDMKRVGGNAIHTQLNGGGTSVRLQAINGNIYLRKG
jgi:lia operon protein LiaG